jgi:MFS family permease
MIVEDKKMSLLGFCIWLLASIFFLYEYFLRTFTGTIADQVMQDFALSVDTFAWVTSAYYFSYGIMQIPVGMLLDKFGVRKILIFGTCVCAFSSIFFAHSGNFTFAFVSRLIMGFGSSFAFITLLIIVSNWFPRKLNGFLSGVSLCIGTLGPVFAGGPMIELLSALNLNWQHLMDIIGIFGLILALIMFFVIKNNNRNGESVTIYLKKEQSFLYYLKTLVRNSQVWFIAIYSGITNIPMILIGGAWGIPYMMSLGFNNAEAASAISLIWIGYAIGALIFGGVSDKIERRRPIIVFSTITNIVLVLALIMLPEQPIYFYSFIFFLIGLGSSGKIVAFSAIVEHVDLATKATAIGINNASITLISSISPIVAAYFIHAAQKSNSNIFLPGDFFNAFLIIPVLSTVAAIIAIFFIKETFCKLQKGPIFLKVTQAR